MENSYFLKQMAGLWDVSIYVYNIKEKMKKDLRKEDAVRRFSEKEAEQIASQFCLEQNDYPIIFDLEKELLMAAIWDENHPDEWILAGPVLTANMKEELFRSICKKHQAIEKLGFQIQVCNRDKFLSGVLLLFWMVTGRELTRTKLWEKNKERSEKIQKILPRVARDIFYRQEYYGPHNPYEQEARELESIRSGDIYALERSLEEKYEGEIGILAKDPLRHHKNVAIGNITLASRAAIEGGVGVEQSFSMADSFIQQVEEMDSVSEVELFKHEIKRAYVQAVKEEQKSAKGERKNPLVAGVKDYIFSHLHSTIQIADIAEHLHVNADYLSHLFRTQEHVTIKRYILQEKIKRSQNLLRYSDYRVQEIGFYLGFSSQSHFTKTFREIVGMNPNEYRKQFGNREKWTTI